MMAQGGLLDKKAEKPVAGWRILISRYALDWRGRHAEDATGSSGGGVGGKQDDQLC